MKHIVTFSVHALVLATFTFGDPLMAGPRNTMARSVSTRQDATGEIEDIQSATQEDRAIVQIIALLSSFMHSITNFTEHPEYITPETNMSLAQMISTIINSSLDADIMDTLIIQAPNEQTPLNSAYLRRLIARSEKNVRTKDVQENVYQDEESRELLRQTFATLVSNASDIIANPRNKDVLGSCISNMLDSIVKAILAKVHKSPHTAAAKQIQQMALALSTNQDMLADIEAMVIARTGHSIN